MRIKAVRRIGEGRERGIGIEIEILGIRIEIRIETGSQRVAEIERIGTKTEIAPVAIAEVIATRIDLVVMGPRIANAVIANQTGTGHDARSLTETGNTTENHPQARLRPPSIHIPWSEKRETGNDYSRKLSALPG